MRITNNRVYLGGFSYNGFGPYKHYLEQLDIEEFPHEKDMHWAKRELPYLLMVMLVIAYIASTFGAYFFLFLFSLMIPIAIWVILLKMTDHI